MGRPCQKSGPKKKEKRKEKKSGPGSNYKGSKIEKETTYNHNGCPMLESGLWYKKSKSVRPGMGTFVCTYICMYDPSFH